MDIELVKRENIIDMAWGFSAMTRVFEKKATRKIVSKLALSLPQIAAIKDNAAFRNLHADFCRWFVDNIRTAERKKDGVVIKESAPASYGQGAKVLDVALKVYAYYCHLPDPETAERIIPWLNSAIDTRMMAYLRGLAEGRVVRATSIEQVKDEDTYTKLQALVHKDIERNFPIGTLAIQWDDVKWRELNR
jgi:hypothetical protein